MKKFSLSKFQREFNECIEMDIMYWGKQMVLHMVDTATGYSELVPIGKKIRLSYRKLWILAGFYDTDALKKSEAIKNSTQVSGERGCLREGRGLFLYPLDATSRQQWSKGRTEL